MKDHDDFNVSVSRREFMRLAGAGGAVLGLGAIGGITNLASAAPSPSESTQGGARAPGPYNILFVLTDQERFFRPGELPASYSLPAHERLTRQGITFVITGSTPACVLAAGSA